MQYNKEMIDDLLNHHQGCLGLMRRLNLTEMYGIHFEESGLARFNTTIGFLQGTLVAAGNNLENPKELEAAKALACDFLNAITQYVVDRNDEPMWTTVSDFDTWKYPKRMIVFADDSTFGGFGFGMYNLCENPFNPSEDEKKRHCMEIDVVGKKLWYRMIMYGGLIYHNRSNNPLTVKIGTDSRVWCYHT